MSSKPAPTLETLKSIVSADHPEGNTDFPETKKRKFEEPVVDDEDVKKRKSGDFTPEDLRPEPSFFKAFMDGTEEKKSISESKSKHELADGLIVDAPLAPVAQTRKLDDDDDQQDDTRRPSRRVLVVDDSVLTRRFVQRIFESHGYQVDVCHNGWQAFAQMQSRLYDFVFLDIEMPVMNGYRCAQAIRKWEEQVGRKERQVICALTSHTEDHERELGKDIGMNFFEAKPARPKRLLDIVDQAVKMAHGDAPAAAALAAIATAQSCGKLKDLGADDDLDNDDCKENDGDDDDRPDIDDANDDQSPAASPEGGGGDGPVEF